MMEQSLKMVVVLIGGVQSASPVAPVSEPYQHGLRGILHHYSVARIAVGCAIRNDRLTKFCVGDQLLAAAHADGGCSECQSASTTMLAQTLRLILGVLVGCVVRNDRLTKFAVQMTKLFGDPCKKIGDEHQSARDDTGIADAAMLHNLLRHKGLCY